MVQGWTLLRVGCRVVGLQEPHLILGCLTLMLDHIRSIPSLLRMQFMRERERERDRWGEGEREGEREKRRDYEE